MKATGERFIPGQAGQIELEHLNRYYFVIKQVDLKDKVVLDIASGEGYGSDLLAQHSKFVYGVDISSEAVEYSKNKYKRENLTYLQGSADAIPIQDKTIDVLVSFETIEHHDKHLEMMYEIKRVLKKDGVLIISSPDKLNYSDIPNYKNKFHVKELYYEDFKSFISKHFKYTLFFGQRIFVGSIIALYENVNEYKRPIVINKEGTSFEFNPSYNIAIATDNNEFKLNYHDILYKETDTIITADDAERVKQKLLNSRSYILGNLILTPVRSIKRLFKKNELKGQANQ